MIVMNSLQAYVTILFSVPAGDIWSGFPQYYTGMLTAWYCSLGQCCDSGDCRITNNITGRASHQHHDMHALFYTNIQVFTIVEILEISGSLNKNLGNIWTFIEISFSYQCIFQDWKKIYRWNFMGSTWSRLWFWKPFRDSSKTLSPTNHWLCPFTAGLEQERTLWPG